MARASALGPRDRPGAVHAPRDLLESKAGPPLAAYHDPAIDPARNVLVHRAIAGRSALAAKPVKGMGCHDVAHMPGGFIAWREGQARLAFQALERATVDRFHEVALAAGGQDNGGPGERLYHSGYYAAFVLDPDGNNIEAVNHGLLRPRRRRSS